MKYYDFLIVGSGFSGSVTAMALTNLGYSVCLIEKRKHPRFSIGESSTPIADMILRDLADEYNLPFLNKLSRYGEWQKHYPEIICGLKRGFSYYPHEKGKKFYSDKNHNRELLVAASENDMNSDTNWLRSDVDAFLIKQAESHGVTYLEETKVINLSRDSKRNKWSVILKTESKQKKLSASWIIDASGSSEFSTRFLNTKSVVKGFKTNSCAIYTHFENVDLWSDYLKLNGYKVTDYPYNPDFSALHHLVDEGWIWMLRFNNNRLSAGLLLDMSSNKRIEDPVSAETWNKTINNYPSLKQIFFQSELAVPPNRFFTTQRLQRRLDRVYGDDWVALPHTAGFVDPLHSTGIAFTLSGVEMLLNLFAKNKEINNIKSDLEKYQDKISKELSFIDLLVSLSYKTRNLFDLFSASTMLYFVASIRYEQSRLGGSIPETFLCAGEPEIRNMVIETFQEIDRLNLQKISIKERTKTIERIRNRINPYNTVGLMNSACNNMYRHTAVEL